MTPNVQTSDTPSPRHGARRRLALGRLRALVCTLATVAIALVAHPVVAHESKIPIAADLFDLRTQINNSLTVTITDQEAILLSHDPRTTDIGILVYGTGVNGGGTGLIDLEAGFWSELEEEGEFVGYSYDDPDGTNGGVTQVTYKNRELHVTAFGENWTWEPTGPQDEVWFHFVIDEEFLCAEFDETSAILVTNEANAVWFADSDAPAECPEQVCGNGVRELPEVCDDGNLIDGDGCSANCESVECETPDFDSTFDGIQEIVFSSPVYGCNNEACHNPAGSEPKGNLDLTPGNSFDQLIHQVATAPFYTITDEGVEIEFLERVVPGEAPASMLFHVLEARTNGNPHVVPSMPVNGDPLLEDHLGAIEKWIRSGAPRDQVVEGTAGLLGACLPESDPLKLEEPPMPPLGEAIQLQQTAWDLPHGGEDEICMATWYDFTKTELIPEGAQLDCPEFDSTNNPSGKCFSYNRRVLLQDGQSHHSIIQIYNGVQGLLEEGSPGEEDRQFGPFTYKPNGLDDPKRGLACDPTDIDPATGFNKDCSGVVVSGATCTGYGPVDVFQAPSFAGSQEPYVDNTEPEGVYATLPMSGVVVWNSHAFNLTEQDSTMAQYLNIYFALADERLYPQQGIFDIDDIYIQKVPPFETREYCKTYTIPDGANLYELGSHTHRWGTKFRIWGPPNEPCDPGDPGGALTNQPFTCEPDCACGPGEPDQLLYFSTEYTDPVQLDIDPPMTFGEAVADRTFIFCSEYDNGSTPTSPPVKRQSTSPAPPDFDFFGINLPIGGPCPDVDSSWFGLFPTQGVACMDGPNKGLACGTEDGASFCETAPGAGDGECDACEVLGGFTTEDEMFILLGSWFRESDGEVPEPALIQVLPNSGTQGDALEVVLTGENTSWNEGSTVSFGEDIEVTSTSVESETTLRVEIAIVDDAAVGFVDVSVSTGEEEVVVLDAAFEILELIVPALNQVVPNSGTQGEALEILLTGENTSWNEGSTASFGGDIEVTSTSVESETTLRVEIAIDHDAAVGFVDVSVSTGEEEVVGLDAAFEILELILIPALNQVVPDSGAQGEALEVLLTGENTSWNESSTVSFGEGIDVTSTSVESETAIRVEIAIDREAALGFVDVSVSTSDEGGEPLRGAAEIVMLEAAFETLAEPFDPLPENGRLEGCIEPGGSALYQFSSNGMENLTANFKGHRGGEGQGPLQPILSLIDPSDSSLELARANKRNKRVKVKNHPIFAAGDYQLRIEDVSGEGGCFEGKISLNGSGRGGRSPGPDEHGTNPGVTGKWKFHDCVEGGEDVVIPFTPEQGSTLGLKIKGKARGGEGALAPKVSLSSPRGGVLVLGEAAKKLKVGGVLLILGGEHELAIESRDDGEGGCFEAQLELK